MPHASDGPDAPLVRSLVDAIDADPWPLPHADHPQLDALVATLERLRKALFPRTAAPAPRGHGAMLDFVTRLMVEVRRNLERELAAAFACVPGDEPRPAGERAAEATQRFLAELPTIRAVLAVDAQAAYDGDPAARSVDEVILCYPGFFALTIHRVSHALHRLGVPLVPRMMSEWAHSSTGIDIHPGAEIGKGFFVDHGTGVVIGETSTIGDFCKIYQGVTLGAKSFERDEAGRIRKGYKRHPTLEDHVTVYAGATILGGDTVIGRGAVVAGGVFVTQSVPPNHVVAAPKAELRVREQRTGI